MSEQELGARHDHEVDPGFRPWRSAHRLGSGTLGLLAIVHVCVTPIFYSNWSPDTVWFLGTGLGLLLLAVVNLVHVGLGPCTMPTAPAVRGANWAFLVFGIGAAVAVPEPQAFVIVAALALQVVASFRTLRAGA